MQTKLLILVCFLLVFLSMSSCADGGGDDTAEPMPTGTLQEGCINAENTPTSGGLLISDCPAETVTEFCNNFDCTFLPEDVRFISFRECNAVGCDELRCEDIPATLTVEEVIRSTVFRGLFTPDGGEREEYTCGAIVF